MTVPTLQGLVQVVNPETGQPQPFFVQSWNNLVTRINGVKNGGTGLSATPANGQIPIGNGTGYTLANLTAGANVTITNAAGSITIAAAGGAGGGTVTSAGLTMPTGFTVTGSPVTTTGTLAVTTSLSGYVKGSAGAFSAASTVPTTDLSGTLQAAQFPALTGDVTTTAGAVATTLATVNANVGTFGSATAIPTFTVNGKGLITAASSVTPATAGQDDTIFFGDGSDGNVTISSGTTTLTRDMYYNNLTISGTGQLNTAGYRVHVAGTLDISAAPTGAINRNGGAGTNADTTIQGPGGAIVSSTGPLGGNSGQVGGGNGASGSTGAGAQAGLVPGTNSNGGVSGAGGAGGAVGATAGGISRGAGPISTPLDLRRLSLELAQWSTTNYIRIGGGQSGPGGSSGAGDGTGTGGPGGGGGSGAGVVFLAARTIARGSNSNTGIIQAIGGNGANGANGSGGVNRGGGGGGAGGGGGWIYLIYRTLTGSTIVGALDATGGNGGAGSNGVGTGGGGNGGGSGGGGRIDVYNLGAGTMTITNATAAAAGNAATGSTGGATKTATAQRVSL